MLKPCVATTHAEESTTSQDRPDGRGKGLPGPSFPIHRLIGIEVSARRFVDRVFREVFRCLHRTHFVAPGCVHTRTSTHAPARARRCQDNFHIAFTVCADPQSHSSVTREAGAVLADGVTRMPLFLFRSAIGLARMCPKVGQDHPYRTCRVCLLYCVCA